MPEEYESYKQLWKPGGAAQCGEKVTGLQEVGDSFSLCISLLHKQFNRAQWKESKLETFFAASDSEIEKFWKVMLDTEASLESCSYTKKQKQKKNNQVQG